MLRFSRLAEIHLEFGPLPSLSLARHDVHEDGGARPHFSELFALLAEAAQRRDYENPALTDAVTRGAIAAREAGVSPERVLAYLRAATRDAPLAGMGDWYRAVLADRFVARAIEAYFGNQGGAG